MTSVNILTPCIVCTTWMYNKLGGGGWGEVGREVTPKVFNIWQVCEPPGHFGHNYEHIEPVGDDWCWWSQRTEAE